jgi:uncharacterized membrane protein
MKRDTKIVLGVIAAIPTAMLAMSALCSWAIAHGASMQWRLLFRLFCHGMPQRCIDLFGVPMPICTRCVGIYAGMLAAIAVFWAISLPRERVMRHVAFVALVPLGIDGLTQAAGLRTSTNPLRMATGLIAGLAFGLWILSAIDRKQQRSSHILDLT